MMGIRSEAIEDIMIVDLMKLMTLQGPLVPGKQWESWPTHPANEVLQTNWYSNRNMHAA
jgi:hypothetical protein